MADYTGLKCPICDKSFTSDDDVVVCPYCGAPYHRDCFQSKGKCIFEDKHSEGFKWVPPINEEDKSSDTAGENISSDNTETKSDGAKVCPRCSHKNNPDALFCDKCGFSFSGSNPYSGYQNPNMGQTPNQPPFGGGMPFMMDPLGGINPDEDFDGVKASELAKYIKGSVPYYLNEFKKIKEHRSSRFNFSGFLFSGGWMLYRKQYKWGIVITAILAAILIFTTFMSAFVNQAVLAQAMTTAGVSGSALSSQNIQAISSAISTLPWYSQLFFYSPFILYIFQFAMMIFVGVRGNRMYMKHCIRSVKRIKDKNLSTDELEKQLSTKGGINTPLAMILLLCYVIISYLPFFII